MRSRFQSLLFCLFLVLANIGVSRAAAPINLPLTLSSSGHTYSSFTLEKDSSLTLTLTAPAASYGNNDKLAVWIVDAARSISLGSALGEYWVWLANENGVAESETLQLQAGTYTVDVGSSSVVASATLTIAVAEAPHNDGAEYADRSSWSLAPVLAAGFRQAATLGYKYVSAAQYGYPTQVLDSGDAFSFTPTEDGTVSFTVHVNAIHLPYDSSSVYVNLYTASSYPVDDRSLTFLKAPGSFSSGAISVQAGTQYVLAMSSSDLDSYLAYEIEYSFTPKSASACAASTLHNCTSSTQCTENAGYWYDETCNAAPQDNTNDCAVGATQYCTTQAACTSAQGYWNFDWCDDTPQTNPDHHATYCEQGYTDYCEQSEPPATTPGTTVGDWIQRTDLVYQPVATLVSLGDGSYQLNGGSWNNGHPNASGQYDGNGARSRATYNFVGQKTYAAFKVHGAGQYAAWWVKPWYLPMTHMNTNHSFNNGLLIPDDTQIYAVYDIADSGAWSVTLATGNYADAGGTTIHSVAGTLTATQLAQLANSPFQVAFSDNYAGTSASMVIGEVRVGTAAPRDAAQRADCLFDWGEQLYPELLAPDDTATTTLGSYRFRHYANTDAMLLTVDDERLMYFGPLAPGAWLDLGPLETWLTQAGCR